MADVTFEPMTVTLREDGSFEVLLQVNDGRTIAQFVVQVGAARTRTRSATRGRGSKGDYTHHLKKLEIIRSEAMATARKFCANVANGG